jgi:hypothetical protein
MSNLLQRERSNRPTSAVWDGSRRRKRVAPKLH